MRHVIRILIHPAVVIMAIGAVYVWLRLPSGERAEFFTVIAMTAVGASELVAAGVGFALKRHSGLQRHAHLVTAVGALMVAFAALDGVRLVPWIVGGILLSVGGLITLRAATIPTPT